MTSSYKYDSETHQCHSPAPLVTEAKTQIGPCCEPSKDHEKSHHDRELLPQCGVVCNDGLVLNGTLHDEHWDSFPPKQLEPQLLSFITKSKVTIAQQIKESIPGDIVSEKAIELIVNIFENTFLFISAIPDNCTTTNFLALCSLYVKSNLGASVALMVMEYTRELAAPLTPQALDEGMSFRAFIDGFKGLRNNWQNVVKGPCLENVSKFFSLLVISGICDATAVTFSIKEFKVLAPDLTVLQANAPGVIEAFFDTFSFFLEGTYQSWIAKSMSPLFMGESEATKLDEEYVWVKTMWDSIKTGSNEDLGVTKSEFDQRTDSLGLALKTQSLGLSGFAKSVIEARIHAVATIRFNSTKIDNNSVERDEPFAFVLHGTSNIGKTTLATQLIHMTHHVRKKPHGEKYTYIYKEGSKYWDMYKTFMTAVILDDYGQRKDDVADGSTNIIVDLINSIPFKPPMASIEDKESVMAKPDTVAVTTHDKTCRAGTRSICPYSMQKRVNYAIHMKPLPEVCWYLNGKVQGIDSKKVHEKYTNPDGTPKVRDHVVDDVATYTVESAIAPEDDQSAAKLCPYMVVTWRGKALKDIDTNTLCEFLCEMALEHDLKQKLKRAGKANRELADVPMCDHPGCNQMAQFCTLHKGDNPVTDYKVCVDVSEHHSGESGVAFERMDNQRRKKRTFNKEVIPEDGVPSALVEPPDWMQEILPEEEEEVIVEDVTPSVVIEPPGWMRDRLREEEDEDLDQTLSQSYMESFKIVRPLQPHVLSLTGPAATFALGQVKEKVCTTVYERMVVGDKSASILILQSAKTFCNRFDWLQLVPSGFLNRPWFMYFVIGTEIDLLKKRFYKAMVPAFIGFCYLFRKYWESEHVLDSSYWFVSTVFYVIMIFCCYSRVYADIKQRYLTELMTRNDVSAIISNDTRDALAMTVMIGSGLAISVYVLIKIAKQARALYTTGFEASVDSLLGIKSEVTKPTLDKAPPKEENSDSKELAIMEVNGSLIPISDAQVKQRDAEKTPWLKCGPVHEIMSLRAMTTTTDQINTVVKKNLCFAWIGTIDSDKFTSTSNLMMLSPGVAVLPNHYFDILGDDLDLLVFKREPGLTNSQFKCKISRRLSMRVPDSDLCLVHVSSGGAWCADISHLLPLKKFTKGTEMRFTMLYRDLNGIISEDVGTMVIKDVDVAGVQSYVGGYYILNSGKCFAGKCGSPVLTRGNGTCIAGFHTAGIEDSPTGACGIITKHDYDLFRKKIKTEFVGTLDIVEPAPINDNTFGSNVLEPGTIHPKNFLNFQIGSTQFEFLGKCVGRSSGGSNFTVTQITHDVTDVFKVPNIYRAPKFNPQWWGTAEWSQSASRPAVSFPPLLLEMAVLDYESEIKSIISRGLHHKYEPLTLHQNLNGIHGRRHINRLDLSTACGPPLTGTKKKLVRNYEDDGNREFEPMVVKEYEAAVARLRTGEALGNVVKQFPKDEPVTKEKQRKIFASHLVNTLVGRAYFLPVLEFMMINPLETENSVGINCHGPEWQQFIDFTEQYGRERLFAGDYSKYDTKMPCQISCAATRILIDIAQMMGASDDEIDLMHVFSREFLFPYVMIDNALVMFTEGSTISGIPLTTHKNGLEGSLMLRIFVKSVYPNARFRDVMAIATYGDDNTGTVNEKYPLVTMENYAKFLNKYGMTYTNPDKKSQVDKYLDPEKHEFLKRRSVYHEDLGLNLGALAQDSMFRMLHCYIHKKGNGKDNEQVCVDNMQAFMLEAFNHGRDAYEDYREKLREVARRHNLEFFVPSLQETYDDRVQNWIKNYGEEALRYFESKGLKPPRAYDGVAVVRC